LSIILNSAMQSAYFTLSWEVFMIRTLRFCSTVLLFVGGVLCGFVSRADTTSEAQAEAAKIVEELVRPLSDGTSMGMEERRPFGAAPTALYRQYSEFNWRLVEEPLSPADRLNGLTWKGRINWTMAAYRELSTSASPKCWSSWRDVSPSSSPQLSLRKVRGQWEKSPRDSSMGNKLPTQAEADEALRLPFCPH